MILVSLVTGIVGLMFGKSENRILAWPNSPRQQDVILDEQWIEHYRIALVYGDYAEFQFVN